MALLFTMWRFPLTGSSLPIKLFEVPSSIAMKAISHNIKLYLLYYVYRLLGSTEISLNLVTYEGKVDLVEPLKGRLAETKNVSIRIHSREINSTIK